MERTLEILCLQPAKPTKFGIKLYQIREAKPGYCLGFDIYTIITTYKQNLCIIYYKLFKKNYAYFDMSNWLIGWIELQITDIGIIIITKSLYGYNELRI